MIQLMEERLSGDSSVEPDPELENLLRLSVANFSDGVNTGYYINTYTTKQCPTMGGVLEELRLGLERLQHQREQEAMQQSHVVEKDPALLTNEEQKILKGKSPFAEALRTLNRSPAGRNRNS